MGEGENKPKVEGGRSQHHSKKPTWGARQANEKKLLAPFRAPTVGMEETFFTIGSTRDAAKFEETKLKLSRYIQANWKEGGADIGRALEDLIVPDYEEPMDPTPEQEASKVFMVKWEGLYKAYKRNKDQWNENVKKAYALVLMHSHPDLVQRLQMLSEWENINSKQDVIQLLTKI